MSQRQSSSRVGCRSQRQRRGQPLARHQREGEVDQSELVKARIEQQAEGVRIEFGRSHRNADVVALNVQVHDVKRVDLLQREQAMVRERPPVRAVLEHVAVHAALARNRQDRGPLIDGCAGVVGLHLLRASHRAAIELHHVGNAADAVADEPREDAPLALGPLAVIALRRA